MARKWHKRKKNVEFLTVFFTHLCAFSKNNVSSLQLNTNYGKRSPHRKMCACLSLLLC